MLSLFVSDIWEETDFNIDLAGPGDNGQIKRCIADGQDGGQIPLPTTILELCRTSIICVSPKR